MMRRRLSRCFSALLALWFVTGAVTAEAHECPQHDRVPATPAAPSDAHEHHQQGEPAHDCTCPQTCAVSAVGMPLPASAAPTFGPLIAIVADTRAPVPPVRVLTQPHALPFALAPPPTLA